jgi:hypothetical protein
MSVDIKTPVKRKANVHSPEVVDTFQWKVPRQDHPNVVRYQLRPNHPTVSYENPWVDIKTIDAVIGKGAFLNAPLPAGTVVGVYRGSCGRPTREGPYILLGKYVKSTATIRFVRHKTIDGQPNPNREWESDMAFVNEPRKGQEANAIFEAPRKANLDFPLIFVRLVRDLKAGDEITVHYGHSTTRTYDNVGDEPGLSTLMKLDPIYLSKQQWTHFAKVWISRDPAASASWKFMLSTLVATDNPLEVEAEEVFTPDKENEDEQQEQPSTKKVKK